MQNNDNEAYTLLIKSCIFVESSTFKETSYLYNCYFSITSAQKQKAAIHVF